MKNKISGRKWRLFFIFSIILYIVAVWIALTFLLRIPSQYVKLQKIEDGKVINSVLNAAVKNNTEDYQKILDNHFVDFTVYNSDKKEVMYSSLNVDRDLSILNKNVNQQIVSSKKNVSTIVNNQKIDIWVIQYYLSPQSTFDVWIIALAVIISVLLTIVAIALSILFYKYVKPLGRLKQTVQQVSAFQLNMLNNVNSRSEYDNITKQLYSFSKNLEKSMKDTGHKYNKLEQSLMIQNEGINYKNRTLASLSHDLKAPLSLIKLKLESIKNVDNDKNIGDMQEKIDEVIYDINDINRIAYADSNNVVIKKEKIDLIQMINDIFLDYDSLFEKKDLYVDFELDEILIVNQNRIQIKQLIKNALSNIYEHATVHGDVMISCYCENNLVILTFYNDAKKIDEDSLQSIFELFYSSSDNKASSGMGLYTIKNIVDGLSGSVSLENVEKGVILKVELPYEEV